MNEELRRLLALIAEGKTEEATTSAKTLVGLADKQITTIESQKLEAIKSRDTIKAELKGIGTKLGIDIGTDNVMEAIDAIKTKKGVDKTEDLEIKEKEIEKLKQEITDAQSRYTDLETKSKSEAMNMVLERDLALILPKHKAVEELAPYMMQDIKKLAHFEEGKVIFKNEDGTTVRVNGADATLDDMVAQKKEQEIKAKKGIFFNIEVQKSGAGNNGGKKIEDDFIP